MNKIKISQNVDFREKMAILHHKIPIAILKIKIDDINSQNVNFREMIKINEDLRVIIL